LVHFNGKEELRNRPQEKIASKIISYYAVEYQTWLVVGNTLASRGDPFNITGVKRHIALYDLPYFEINVYDLYNHQTL
jgi:hypothetical protein